MYDNLNNYKVFYNVAKYKNLSRAAENLYISQPAISKSIAKLEEGLGVKLFDRTSKGVMLTEEGNILYQHIESAFDSILKGEDEIKKINELGIGQLKIGVSTSLCKHILLDYLKGFITMNPHIKVIIDCHSTINTIRLLQEEKIDIGLICETDIPKHFEYKKLQDIHDIFVASDAYIDNLHLREKDESEQTENPYFFAGNLTSFIPENKKSNDYKLSIKDILEKSNLMLLETNNITRTHIDSYLAAEGIYPNQILEVNNMDLLIDFAAIGMGVAIVVREFATDYLENGQIIELPLEHEVKKRTVGFIYPNNKTKTAVLEKFIEYCM
ncbi:MAG: LysR family transcriptional regulator [Lachnospiraceae bacterium]|nr:LysR family transcriptional regulator [Lachnospiraceae bacterium]